MEAIVNAKNLRISTKKSYEICNLIRNKTTEKAKRILSEVVEMQRAVPYKKFLRDTPHRRGMAAGRYPVKTCYEILRLIKNAEANAQNKGLTKDLVISHISADKGAKIMRYGAKRRARMKNTHITIVVKESKKEAKK
ncbi:MAG: 50S ribosomal protein L22 [Nanoarchaeota archaeon]